MCMCGQWMFTPKCEMRESAIPETDRTETVGLSLRSFLPGPLPGFFLIVGGALATVVDRLDAFDVDGDWPEDDDVGSGGKLEFGPASIKVGGKSAWLAGGCEGVAAAGAGAKGGR